MIGIIGANSFIGRNLVLKLAQKKAVLFARDFEGFEFNKENHDQILMDFKFPETFVNKLTNCTKIILLINSNDLQVSTFEELLKSIDIADTRLEQLIYASSGGAIYGEAHTSFPLSESTPTSPKSKYGQTKLAIENLILSRANKAQWNATILRIGNPIGLYAKKTNFVNAAIDAAKFDTPLKLWAHKDYVRDYFSVTDLCDVIDKVIETPSTKNRIYNVGSGNGHSIDQMLEIIETVADKKIILDQKDPIDEEVRYNVLDCSRIKRDLGWQCKISIEDVIEEIWAKA